VDWIAAAGTVPFLSNFRAVVVRNLLRNDAIERESSDIRRALSALPETARLILVVDDESNDDRRSPRVQKLEQLWMEAVKGAKGAVCNFVSDPKAVPNLVKQRLKELGKSITPRALSELVDRTGSDLSSALGECEKLSLYVGDRGEIGEADVKESCCTNYEWNVFRMVAAALAGQAGEAQKQLRMLTTSSTKTEEAAYRNVFPALSRQLKLIWQCRVCLDQSASPFKVPSEILASLPERGRITGEPEWSIRRAMEVARTKSLIDLTSSLEALALADSKLKGVNPGFHALDTLETLILGLSSQSPGPKAA